MSSPSGSTLLPYKGHEIWFREVDEQSSPPGYLDEQADLQQASGEKYSAVVTGEHVVAPNFYKQTMRSGCMMHNSFFRPIVTRWHGDRRTLVLRSPWLRHNNVTLGRTMLTWIDIAGGGWSDCVYLTASAESDDDAVLRTYMQLLRTLTSASELDALDLELHKFAKKDVAEAVKTWVCDLSDARSLRISVVLEMDNGGCTRVHVSDCQLRTPPPLPSLNK